MNCTVSIDWLTFSVKSDTTPQEVIKYYLRMDEALFEDQGYGLMGYSQMLSFKNILVCYDARRKDGSARDDMGICVSMSGSGCRVFEQMTKWTAEDDISPFQPLFSLLISDTEVHISRLDVACDDRAGLLDVENIVELRKKGAINSRLRKSTLIDNMDGIQYEGLGVYFGSPQSNFRIRIYDKALQMQEEGHWVRVELILKGADCNDFIKHAVGAESFPALVAAVLNDKFSFIELDNPRKERCTVCSWWQQFVDSIEQVHLITREVVEHSVDEIHEWLTSQIARSLSVLRQAKGYGAIAELIDSGNKRLTARQQSIIADYRALREAALVS
ncbi:MAG: replication initiation factor domain-containing protein [Oscillospiraceae bacterium]|nr:replication initiation factor domain-containing protein [Oscillospiraceae bacterium]